MSELPSVYLDGDITVVRASSLGSCVRALSAYGRYEEVVPLQRKQMLNRTAQEGHLHEGTVVDHLRLEGYDVSESQGVVSLDVIKDRVQVRGHIDGAIPKESVVEIKSMSKSRFDDWQRHGLAAFPKYQWQLSAYMYGMADRWGIDADTINAVYAVKRRDDGLIDVRTIDRIPISFQDIRKKLVQVYQHRQKKTLPDCDIKGQEQFWCPFPFLHDEDVVDMDLPDEAVLAIEQLLVFYDEHRDVENAGKEAGKLKREVGAEILKLMDGRDKAEIGEHKITRVKQTRASVDIALLKSDLDPAELAKYEKTNPIEFAKITKRKRK